jgi:NitT/TauT family transport system permease protein
VVLAMWEAIVEAFRIPQYILPPPSEFLPFVVTSWGQLWSATVVTAQEVVAGFLLGAVFSIPLALLLASLRPVRDTLYPLIVFFQVVPKIAVAPLMIIWFGAGMSSVILLTFALCFFPILVNSMAGFSQLDPRKLYITRSMGASRWQTFRYLRVQSAMPFIFAGFRVASVLAVTGAIVGQFVGSNAGLGYLLEASTGILNTDLVFADVVVLSVFGLLVNYAVVLGEALLMPWNRRQRS